MLRNASKIDGYTIVASDGSLGSVSDFLFDDVSWLVRWLVVDTGHWLPGRKVLLPPSVLGHIDQQLHQFSVRLTRQLVKDSPDIDTDKSVSRQMEAHMYDYYGWSPYWGAGLYMGGYGYPPPVMEPSPPTAYGPDQEEITEDRHSRLRSVNAVTGYHLHARDGKIGHVEDFLVEDADWSIRYLVVDTENWWPGKLVLISPYQTQSIDWAADLVNLRVDRQMVKDSPLYEPSTVVDRPYESRFHAYYGGTSPAPD